MPYHGLKCFGVRGDSFRRSGWNNHAGIGDCGSIAAVPPHHTNHSGADLLRQLECHHDVGAYIFLKISTADGKYKEHII